MLLALIANVFKLVLWPLFAWRRARAAPEGAYVAIDVDGKLVDRTPPRARRWVLARSRGPVTSVQRVRELADEIAKDPRVAGVLLRVKGVGPGEAVLASLRAVVKDIRASGKDVVAYLPNGADNRALALAAGARLVILGPETSVAAIGYAAESRFVRRALAKLGVEPEVYARGAYKSAGEMLVRDGLSDANREQLGALLDARYRGLVDALADGRRVAREVAEGWIDGGPYTARAAIDLGIIDGVAYEDELPVALTGPIGGGGEPSVKAHPEIVDLDAYLGARTGGRMTTMRRRGLVGVIEVHGPIVGSARFGFGAVAAEDALIQAVRSARADPRVRAVVLHIDSPGGSAVASDRIHHEVVRLAEKKPVIAYMSNVAASGGYYIAAAAQTIVAQPETITGSIGVVAARFVVGPVLEKLGVATEVEKRGARADMASPTRHLDAGERAAMELEMDAFYDRFLQVVATGRGRARADVEPHAGGRVWTGADAHARGLVDVLGGFERALAEARSKVDGGEDLEPRLVRGRGKQPPPPLGDQVATALAKHAVAGLVGGGLPLPRGLGALAGAALLALNLEGERALLYAPLLDA